MIFYETERLILRNFRETDAQDYHAYMSLASTAMHEDFAPFSWEESVSAVAKKLADDSCWAVELKENQKMIGDVCWREGEYGTYEIAYDFHEGYGKKGYATEACRALLRHVFTVCNARRLYVGCNEGNESSWRLLERLGFRREAHCMEDVTFKNDENGHPIYVNSYFYAMLRREWEKRDA